MIASPRSSARRSSTGCDGPEPRVSVKDPLRRGRRSGDGVVVVVAPVGIDLDLVPYAADARSALAPDARLVLVVPERDAHPVTLALAAALAAPAEVVAVPGDWRHPRSVSDCDRQVVRIAHRRVGS